MTPTSLPTRSLRPVGRRRSLWGRLLSVVAVVATCLAVSTGSAVHAQEGDDQESITWGIRPSTADGPDGRNAFEYDLEPGATLEDYVGVSNFTTQPLVLAVYATDAFTSRDGHFDLLPAVDEPTDVGAWVSFATETVTIPPRSRLDIPFRVTIPRQATPGDHAGGIVASLSSIKADDGGNPLTVDRRVGARIYLRVAGDLEPAAAVTDVGVSYDGTANPARSGSATVTYTIRNTGNVRLSGIPTVDVAGPFGLGRRSAAGPEVTELLPGSELAFEVEVDGARPLGRLRATVKLAPEPVADAPPAPEAMGRASAWALPWPQIALLVLIALAVVAWRRRRVARRAALAAQLEAARAEGREEALVAAGPAPEQEAADL